MYVTRVFVCALTLIRPETVADTNTLSRNLNRTYTNYLRCFFSGNISDIVITTALRNYIKPLLFICNVQSINKYYTHTHTHTHTYKYICNNFFVLDKVWCIIYIKLYRVCVRAY
jgi:hypothetical protein